MAVGEGHPSFVRVTTGQGHPPLVRVTTGQGHPSFVRVTVGVLVAVDQGHFPLVRVAVGVLAAARVLAEHGAQLLADGAQGTPPPLQQSGPLLLRDASLPEEGVEGDADAEGAVGRRHLVVQAAVLQRRLVALLHAHLPAVLEVAHVAQQQQRRGGGAPQLGQRQHQLAGRGEGAAAADAVDHHKGIRPAHPALLHTAGLSLQHTENYVHTSLCTVSREMVFITLSKVGFSI